MSKHQFELIEPEDEMISPSASQISSQDNQSTSERIRLPSGTWILRDTVNGLHRYRYEFDEEQPHISPNQPNQNNSSHQFRS